MRNFIKSMVEYFNKGCLMINTKYFDQNSTQEVIDGISENFESLEYINSLSMNRFDN